MRYQQAVPTGSSARSRRSAQVSSSSARDTSRGGAPSNGSATGAVSACDSCPPPIGHPPRPSAPLVLALRGTGDTGGGLGDAGV
eukprot:3314540-Pyramimonas_sp.AAC.1